MSFSYDLETNLNKASKVLAASVTDNITRLIEDEIKQNVEAYIKEAAKKIAANLQANLYAYRDFNDPFLPIRVTLRINDKEIERELSSPS